MRRAMRLAVVVAGLLGAFAVSGAAFADPPGGQVNGQGQTPLSASLGFNAQSDLTGSLEYNADPQGPDEGFAVHCNDYTSYALVSSKHGTPKVLVTASNCVDQDGTQIYMTGSFSDRGEPGVHDSLCVAFSYTFPVDPKTAAVHDMGLISNGNIQIHA